MNTLNLGPLAVPFTLLPWLAGLLVAWLLAWYRRRRGHPDVEPILSWMLIGGLVGARIAFVARYQDRFSGFLEMLDLRDGGLWWPGAIAGATLGLALAWLRRRRQPDTPALLTEALRTAVAGAIAAVLVAAVTLALTPASEPAPDITFHDLDGEPLPLDAVRGDGVTLINLWASWCPPCRREMPVLEQGQSDYPDVAFVYANQGEGGDVIRRYLTGQSLRLDRVVMDPHSDLARSLGGAGLPTTLILDSQGQVVDSHTGPLSPASLHHLLAPYLQEQ